MWIIFTELADVKPKHDCVYDIAEVELPDGIRFSGAALQMHYALHPRPPRRDRLELPVDSAEELCHVTYSPEYCSAARLRVLLGLEQFAKVIAEIINDYSVEKIQKVMLLKSSKIIAKKQNFWIREQSFDTRLVLLDNGVLEARCDVLECGPPLHTHKYLCTKIAVAVTCGSKLQRIDHLKLINRGIDLVWDAGIASSHLALDKVLNGFDATDVPIYTFTFEAKNRNRLAHSFPSFGEEYGALDLQEELYVRARGVPSDSTVTILAYFRPTTAVETKKMEGRRRPFTSSSFYPPPGINMQLASFQLYVARKEGEGVYKIGVLGDIMDALIIYFDTNCNPYSELKSCIFQTEIGDEFDLSDGARLKKMHEASSQRFGLAAAAREGFLVMPFPISWHHARGSILIKTATNCNCVVYISSVIIHHDRWRTLNYNKSEPGAITHAYPIITTKFTHPIVNPAFASADLSQLILPHSGRFPSDLLTVAHPAITSVILSTDDNWNLKYA
jgi:hypothetical protein